jgi:hypothetical protein
MTTAARGRLINAMATVERLLTPQLVEIAPEDPTSGAARFCPQSYFAELDTRFDDGFDPDMSIRAESDDLVPPAGLLLAYAHHWFEKGLTGRHDDTRKGPE